MAQSRSFGKRLLRWLGLLLAGWLAFSIGSVLLMRWLDPLTSAFMLRDRAMAFFNGDQDYRFAHQWVDWHDISAHAKLAVIASEDQKFAEHWGFDFESMEKAWQHNQRGRKVRGGSTISQQVAKNLYLWPGQSYVRKGIEAYFTLLIETLWPKQRILEVYLNSAEFGKGVFGVEAASRRYFRKPAARLNARESALLAAVLPAPKRLLVNRPSGFVYARQAWIGRQMVRLGGPELLSSLQ
ncbi:MAG: monofunctional biosynthetic peptidoglycan transglycosylase [Steroidobacteraceae bacterium]